MKQVATMNLNGTNAQYKVMYDETKPMNQYRIFKAFFTRDGRKHFRLIEKYADMPSAMLWLADIAKTWEYQNN